MRQIGTLALAPAAARGCGFVIGSELQAHGVDFSFAPVVDLDYGRSSVIGDRAFHRNPNAVAHLAAAFRAGLRSRGIELFQRLWMEQMFRLLLTGRRGEIPDLVRFFRRHADVVGMASFQLQADTGRGVLRERDRIISLETVRQKIGEGAGTGISWDTVLIGHPACHRIGITLEANGRLYDLNDDPAFFNRFLADFQHVMLDRRYPRQAAWALAKEALRDPAWIGRALRFFLPKIWKMKRDLIAARGRVHKLSFFVQNFMDASALEPERIHACSFMVMTADGPISMCAHNARRDEFILKPLAVETEAGRALWNPLSGSMLPVVQRMKKSSVLSYQPSVPEAERLELTIAKR